jgi:hypothetical protein
MGCKNPETDKKEIDREYANLIVSEEQDKLIMISSWEQLKFGAPCAFVNSKGDTIIPYGNYHAWDPMDLYTYAIVKSPDRVVGINRQGKIMFDAYLWGDAQLDNISEGLFRVKRNGKIGYANKIGEIVIPCQFDCAEQFENGVVKVALECEYSYDAMEQVEMKSDNWFYIDKEGNKTTTPQHYVKMH